MIFVVDAVPQGVVTVYLMVSVPTVAPVTTPAAVMAAWLLVTLHTPPAMILVKVIGDPAHTPDGPVIVPAVGAVELTLIIKAAVAVPQPLVTV